MLGFRKVAVTGGLSSGKSTVCHLFEIIGARVLSADAIVHQLLSPKTSLGKQLIGLFGNDVIKDGKFDRKAIASRVFSDAQLLKQLEEILHPAVYAEMKNYYHSIDNPQQSPLFVVEVPLLFESDYPDWFDTIIAVEAPEEQCIKRFEAIGGSKEEFMRRMQHQLSTKEKSQRADYLIMNNQDINTLKQCVMQIYQELTLKELHPE